MGLREMNDNLKFNAGDVRVNELIYCPFCGKTEAAIVLNEYELNNTYPEETRHRTPRYAVCCVVHGGGCGASSGLCNTREGAVNDWNNRSKLPNAEPEPMKRNLWQAETQEFKVNGCQIILRTEWREENCHCLEIVVMLECDEYDNIKDGLRSESIVVGHCTIGKEWGLRSRVQLHGKTFREMRIEFGCSLVKAKKDAKEYVSQLRMQFEKLERGGM